MTQRRKWSLCLGILLLFNSCVGGYSFTGASISPETKTISILDFQNRATLVQPVLATHITDALRNKFSTQTSLVVVEYEGDMDIKGEIVTYSVSPTAIQGNDKAARNRLTITVKVKFTDRHNPKADFDQMFSRFRDYDSSQNLSDVEEVLINEITNELVDDIFNKAVVNW